MGIYGLSGLDEISPTYLRLPGYPAFLAAVFAVFGMEHYRTVLVVQMFIDIGTCFLIADIARRRISARAAKAAFLLAALCPFLANYVAARSYRNIGNILYGFGVGFRHRWNPNFGVQTYPLLAGVWPGGWRGHPASSGRRVAASRD